MRVMTHAVFSLPCQDALLRFYHVHMESVLLSLLGLFWLSPVLAKTVLRLSTS